MRLPIITLAGALVAASPGVVHAQPTRPAAAASAEVDEFAREAAQNSLTQILLASMAMQKTNDDRVLDYAWTMLDHHARAMGDLAEALSPGAAPVPIEPSAQQNAALRRMRGLSATQFDQAYFAHQSEAHARAIVNFERGSRLSDPDVGKYARLTLPILRAHQEITRITQAEPPKPMMGQ